VTNGLKLVNGMGNESWKGRGGHLEAEEIRSDLRRELGREPTKGDFREAGKYKVWMALYRHGRKSFQDEEECTKQYNRFREGFLKSNSLMKRIWMMCAPY
jgi:hypothetical protein